MRKLKNIHFDLHKHIVLKLGAILLLCLLFISVGFSSLSSYLTVDGHAKFDPVAMIRVTSIESDSLTNVTELSRDYTLCSINNLLEFDDETGVATYNVNITNYGQIDQVLTQIVDEVYTNDDIEYSIEGLKVDDIIKAGESINFKITFRYKDGVSNPESTRLNSKIKFIFENSILPTTFPVVFTQVGACTFNGSSQTITGENCTKFRDKYYIDTGIALYNDTNYLKDYEIGFTVDEYTPENQVAQAVFVNAKYENETIKWPGLVFRKGGSNNLELTQSINYGNKKSINLSNFTTPYSIRILRINNVVYCSINDGELIKLQDITGFNQQFDITTWFGASPDVNGNPMRHLKATLSNMYIKLGTYEFKTYKVTFDPNGGTVSEITRNVKELEKIGTLPIPTNADGKIFQGWYTDQTFTTPIDENVIPSGDCTYYAKWSSYVAKINDQYYNSISDAVNDVPSNGVLTTIDILDDANESITIPEGKNILLNIGNHTIRNSANATIVNNGTLKIVDGTLRNNSGTAVINNNKTGVLEITGGNIISYGNKQALYNDGGRTTISGDAYLSSSSTGRSTVHNLNNGTLTITGGTIISTGEHGINNADGTLVIGNNDGNIDSSTPIIQGKKYGITTSPNFSLYDGIIKGVNKAVNDETKINLPDNSEISTGTEDIDSVTYKTLYLTPIGS